jgi:cell wall-associated NlpC family hydrolase
MHQKGRFATVASDRQQGPVRPSAAAAACLAFTLALSLSGTAHAAPKPSKAAAQKKLDKLSDQVDLLVEKYNKSNEDLKAVKRKLASAKKAAGRENEAFEKARRGVVEMAASAYKNGNDTADLSALISGGDPQAVLDQAAMFTQVSQSRASQITQFFNSAQRVERERAHAQDAYDTVNEKFKDIKGQKAVIEKAITKQKALVRKLGGDEAPNGGQVGGTYDGPATGNAKAALDYAYAQLGKPYRYGGAGPGSFDCSGLTMMAWKAGGVALPHNAAAQYSTVKHVAYKDLQPGDLVFFQGLGHMGMYVGGEKMIHAPRTGSFIQIVSIGSGSYYSGRFLAGGRP